MLGNKAHEASITHSWVTHQNFWGQLISVKLGHKHPIITHDYFGRSATAQVRCSERDGSQGQQELAHPKGSNRLPRCPLGHIWLLAPVLRKQAMPANPCTAKMASSALRYELAKVKMGYKHPIITHKYFG